MQRTLGALLILTWTLFIGGCNVDTQKVYGKDNGIKSIASLSPSTTELLGFHYNTNRIVGRTKSCDFPVGIQAIPVVADVKPDYEKLQKIKPDLIIYDKHLYSEDDIAKIKQLGTKTFEYNPNSFDEYVKQASEVASFSGAEVNLWKQIDNAVRAAGEAKSLYKTRPKVAMLMPSEPGGTPYIAGLKSFQADLLRNAADEPVGPDADKFVQVNPEDLIKMDPDFIITAGDASSFINDARFASLKAIKNKHVVGIASAVLLRAGARVDKAIQAIGKQTHP